MKLPATMLPSVPVPYDVDAIVAAPRDDVALAGVIDALAVGADPVAGGAAGDHHSAAE